jgi:hypothetical protein
MYTHCLLFAALIFAAFPPSAQHRRGAAPMSGVTIVERLRSELLAVLSNEAGAAEGVNFPAGQFTPYLTRVASAREEPDGLPSPQPTVRRGSKCWWLWLLAGIDVCSYDAAWKP